MDIPCGMVQVLMGEMTKNRDYHELQIMKRSTISLDSQIGEGHLVFASGQTSIILYNSPENTRPSKNYEEFGKRIVNNPELFQLYLDSITGYDPRSSRSPFDYENIYYFVSRYGSIEQLQYLSEIFRTHTRGYLSERYYNCECVLEHAVSYGRNDLILFVYNKYHPVVEVKWFTIPFRENYRGCMTTFKLLMNLYTPNAGIGEQILNNMIPYVRSYEQLRYLIGKFPVLYPTCDTIEHAIFYKNKGVIKLLSTYYKKYSNGTGVALFHAATRGYDDVILQMCKYYNGTFRFNLSYVYREAIINGHKNTLLLLIKLFPDISPPRDIFTDIVRNGKNKFDMLSTIAQHFPELSKNSCAYYAYHAAKLENHTSTATYIQKHFPELAKNYNPNDYENPYENYIEYEIESGRGFYDDLST